MQLFHHQLSVGKPGKVIIFVLLMSLILIHTATAQQPSDEGIDLIILLDQSGSMSGAGGDIAPTDPEGRRLDAARYLIDYMAFDNNSVNPQRINRVVVIGFGSRAELMVNLTELKSEENINRAKSQIVGRDLGNTNFVTALETVREVFPLGTDSELDTRRRIIVLITDGGPYDTRELTYREYFEEIASYYDAELGKQHYPLYVVGVDRDGLYWGDVVWYWNDITSDNPADDPHAFRAYEVEELNAQLVEFLCPFLGQIGTSRDCRLQQLGDHFIQPYAHTAQFSIFKYRDDTETTLHRPPGTEAPVDGTEPDVRYSQSEDGGTEVYIIHSPEAGCWRTNQTGEGRVDVFTDVSFRNFLTLTTPAESHAQLVPLKLEFEARDEQGNPIIEYPEYPVQFTATLIPPDGSSPQNIEIARKGGIDGLYESVNDLFTPEPGIYTVEIAGSVEIPPIFGCTEGETLELFEKSFTFEVFPPEIHIVEPAQPHLQYNPLQQIVLEVRNSSGQPINLAQAAPWTVTAMLEAPSGSQITTVPPDWDAGHYVIPGPLVLSESGTYTVSLKADTSGEPFYFAQATFDAEANVSLLFPPTYFPIHTPILTATVQLQDTSGQPFTLSPDSHLRIEAALVHPENEAPSLIALEPVTGTVPGLYTASTPWQLDDAIPYTIRVTGYTQLNRGPSEPEYMLFETDFPLNGSLELPRFTVITPTQGLDIEYNVYALHGGFAHWFPTPMEINVQLWQGEEPARAEGIFQTSAENIFSIDVVDVNGNVLIEGAPLRPVAEQPGLFTTKLENLTEEGDYQVAVHMRGKLHNGSDYDGLVPAITVPFRLIETPLFRTVRIVVKVLTALAGIAVVGVLAYTTYGYLPPYPRGQLIVKEMGLNGREIHKFPLNQGTIKKKKVALKNIPSRLQLSKIVVTRAPQVKSHNNQRPTPNPVLTRRKNAPKQEEIIEIEAYSVDRNRKTPVAKGKLYGLRSQSKIRSSQNTDDGKRYEFLYNQ